MLVVYVVTSGFAIVQNSKQYNSTKYQMVDLSDSFEAKMLESLRRQAMEGGSDSDSDDTSKNAKPARSLSRFKYGDDSASDSSDDASESKAQVCGSSSSLGSHSVPWLGEDLSVPSLS